MKKNLSKKIVSLVTVFALAVALMPTSLVSADTAPVTVEKSAKWIDLNNQIAEISVKVNAKNQIVTAKTDVVFAIDVSGSMMGNDIINAKNAIKSFTDAISKNTNTNGAVRVGIVGYNNKAEKLLGLTSNYSQVTSVLNKEFEWQDMIFKATNIQAGIKQAKDMLNNSTATNKYIIVIGDGEPTKSFKITQGKFTGVETKDTCWSYPKLVRVFPPKFKDEWVHGIKVTDFDFTPTACNYDEIVGNGFGHNLGIFTDYTVDKDYTAKCSHDDSCTDAMKYKVNDNNQATLFEAGLAKKAGIKMFSIGYGVSGDAETILKKIADNNCYVKARKNTNDIYEKAVKPIENKIVKEVSQGTNASLTEAASSIKINGTAVDYQIVAGSINVTSGTTTTNGNSINWAIGNLPNGSATLTYRVKITTPLPTGNNTITLGNAGFKYENVSNQIVTATSATAGAPLQYSKHTVKFIGYEENADRQLVQKVLKQDDYFKNETVNAPALTETAGYTFAWPKTSVIVANANETVTAVAAKKSFDVKFFDFANNQIGETQSVKYLESATAPADPTAVDKDFTGWGTEAWKSVTGNTDVYPNGTIKKFDVSYEVKDLETGETTPVGTTNDVEYNTASSTLTAPEFTLPEGYEVAEDWTLPESITSDVTVTKTIQKKKFNVSYEVKDLETDETTPVDTIEGVKFNTASSTLTAPEFTLPEGYEVAEDWTLPENITSDVTVTKTTQKKTFKVEFKDYDGNTIGDAQVIKYGDSAVEPAKPVDTTKTFTKWSSEEWKEVKSDLTVTAEFNSVVIIDDDDTPLINIPDDDIPTAPNPKTGIEYSTVILMLVALTVATTTLVLKKKAQVK